MSRLPTTARLAIAVIVLLLSASSCVTAQGYNDADNSYGQGSYQQFYDELAPYGAWVNDPQYGYVWVPDAGADFRPYYSDGYWANTDYGNTWVSSYRWGWAPFHYGRWTYSDYYGWAWIPGNEWGPAWVSWRSGGGAYGWAPLGPGISVSASFGSGYYAPDNWWTFTPQQYILSPNFHQHSYGPRYNSSYIHQTTIINNTYVNNHNTYIAGPRRNELEHATGRPVNVVSINNSTRPDRSQLQGNSLSIYRPVIAESRPRATERPREFRNAQQPAVASPNDLQPARMDRNATYQPVQQQPQVRDRPVRSDNNAMQPQRDPGYTRPQPAVRMPASVQPDRQPAQVPQPQRIERSSMPEQRPAPVQRVEAPRTMPQREVPAAAPVRSGVPQSGGGGDGTLRNR